MAKRPKHSKSMIEKINLVERLLSNGMDDYIRKSPNPTFEGFWRHVKQVATKKGAE